MFEEIESFKNKTRGFRCVTLQHLSNLKAKLTCLTFAITVKEIFAKR